jgi:hypothetical protein
MAAQHDVEKEQNENKNKQSRKMRIPGKVGFYVLFCAAVLSVLYFTNKAVNDTQRPDKSKNIVKTKQATQQITHPAEKDFNNKSVTTEKSLEKPLTGESTVQEILTYAESSKDRWGNMSAVGHIEQGSTQNGVNKQYFKVSVEKPDKYWLEEGPSIMVSNGKKQWRVMTDLKRVVVSDVYKMPPEEQARLDKVIKLNRHVLPTIGGCQIDTTAKIRLAFNGSQKLRMIKCMPRSIHIFEIMGKC